MCRRALVVAAGISLAGYVTDLTGSTTDEGSDPGDKSDDEERTTIEAPTLAEQGRPTTICEESIKPDGIRALVEPDDRVFSDREEGVGNNGNLVMLHRAHATGCSSDADVRRSLRLSVSHVTRFQRRHW
jgi:hypothetical protein